MYVFCKCLNTSNKDFNSIDFNATLQCRCLIVSLLLSNHIMTRWPSICVAMWANWGPNGPKEPMESLLLHMFVLMLAKLAMPLPL